MFFLGFRILLACAVASLSATLIYGSKGADGWTLVPQNQPGEYYGDYEGFGREKVLAINGGCLIKGFTTYRRDNPKTYRFIFPLDCTRGDKLVGRKKCEVFIMVTDSGYELMNTGGKPNPFCEPLSR